MMSLESRTIARKRASFRSRSAVTRSTVRAARRPTTRVETIASTTIATSSDGGQEPLGAHVLICRYFAARTLSADRAAVPGQS